MSDISIVLPKTDYHGGEAVRGNVVLTVDEDIPARGVRLVVRGHETSLLHTGAGRAMATRAAERVWFLDELTLFGDPKLDLSGLIRDSVGGIFSKEHYPILTAGTYEYAFSYDLPKALPGDYESPRGDVAIRYDLRAYVDVPFRVDIEHTERLTVYEPYEATDESASITDNKSFPMSADSQLVVKATLDKSAYKLGETVHIELDIENQSSHSVEGIEVGLRQTEYLGESGEGDERSSMICEKQFPDKVLVPATKKTHSIDYKIDETLYPTLSAGKLVRVGYHVVVTFDIPWARDLHVAVPITLVEEPGKPGGAAE